MAKDVLCMFTARVTFAPLPNGGYPMINYELQHDKGILLLHPEGRCMLHQGIAKLASSAMLFCNDSYRLHARFDTDQDTAAQATALKATGC